MRDSRALWLILAVAVCVSAVGSVGAWVGVNMAGASIATSANILKNEAELFRQRNGPRMSYSQIIFHLPGGGTEAYTEVTNYVPHDGYVSFNGIPAGGDHKHDFEINRSHFEWVELIP